MSIYKELDYNSEISDIKELQFSVSSPEEIKRKSVVHVTQTGFYDNNGEPLIGGLFDPRLGVLDLGKRCPTDELDNRFSPGYFGHIELVKPVISYQFLDIVLKVLKCYCIRCSSILIDKEDENNKMKIDFFKNEKNRKKFYTFYDICSKNKVCPVCNFVQPFKFVKEGLAKIYGEWKDSSSATNSVRELLNPERIHRIFKRITDEDCAIMGFDKNWCRPDWLICTVLPVCPPAVRPSVRQHTGQRSEDDITHKLINIIKVNNNLKNKLEVKSTPAETIEGFWDYLQYEVATYVDNEIPNVTECRHRSGRALKVIVQRLKGKEGRIRGNLMGKRVDFSARTVITPDPNIKIDQLGVPLKIAKNLTYPEIVNRYNIVRLTKMIRNGPDIYPGAKSIKKASDGSSKSLLYIDRDNIDLELGDIVHRHLIDDDNVLFNRQPSLHKMSMMAHRVKVMKHNTFRLNVSVTTPYNADFDGDEMNMHVPQSIQTSIELRQLARVPLQIISPRTNGPLIKPVQDTMLGIYRITNDNVFFTEKEMMNMLVNIESFDGNLPEPAVTEPYKRWTGYQLLSLILPPINMEAKTPLYDKSIEGGDKNPLHTVKIRDGNVLQGRMDKKIIAGGSKGIVHTIYNDYGETACQRFLDNIQDVITKYILLTGFSVGISDLIADKKTKDKMNKNIESKKKEISKVFQHLHLNIFENNEGIPMTDKFEAEIERILSASLNESGNIGLSSLDENNRMTNMVSSGSKGSVINISQMISCLGQQKIDGKRIPYGFTDRTLPHFQKYDDSPEARGFVESSFIDGLTPQEFFFHAMGGREGLIDTACKTSETGYIQRKLIKALEDLKVNHDLSIRNARGRIIQFMYGEDGFNYTTIESQHLELLDVSFKDLMSKHRFKDNEKWEDFMESEIIEEMKSNKDYQTIMSDFYEVNIHKMKHTLKTGIVSNNQDSMINYPINLDRLVKNTKNLFNIEDDDLSDLNPITVIERLREIEQDLKRPIMDEMDLLFKCLINTYLSPKVLIKKYRINSVAFEHIINMIKLKYSKSFISVSEMVGVIAAQSMGEPATQMTLNTFHLAGVGKPGVTRGVPRLKEILHLSKNIKSPSITVYLNKPDSYSINKVQAIANKFELTTLSDLVLSSSIYYDPSDSQTEIESDNTFMEVYNLFNELEQVDKEMKRMPWVLRFEFNKDALMNKNITMNDIYFAIISERKDSNDLSCFYSDDNASKIIFRIRFNDEGSGNDSKDIQALKNYEKNLLSLVVKGIDKINKVIPRKDLDNIEFDEGEYKKKDQWLLDTDGSNLQEILAFDEVDIVNTFSNDIIETYNVFGIDAAKQLLINEFTEVLDSSGNYVNYRHISLLCDFMTNKGSLVSIDRFGINRDTELGPLAKCSFEETTEQIFKAAIFGEKDKLNGVSANIMMGQLIPSGTGDTTILLDEMKLLEVEKQKEEVKMEEDDEVESACVENIGIDFDINAI
uniref:DNA-directed RNA polymerase subunit n=1 Tax=Mimiviridae sp. ChoanoV1 TaxID=2596887 RepID=A0A5B8IPW1_9VIRU|nr:RNA polymerase Rpb1, domain 5 [Mimiviridae sp. ChoanoV1]